MLLPSIAVIVYFLIIMWVIVHFVLCPSSILHLMIWSDPSLFTYHWFLFSVSVFFRSFVPSVISFFILVLLLASLLRMSSTNYRSVTVHLFFYNKNYCPCRCYAATATTTTTLQPQPQPLPQHLPFKNGSRPFGTPTPLLTPSPNNPITLSLALHSRLVWNRYFAVPNS